MAAVAACSWRPAATWTRLIPLWSEALVEHAGLEMPFELARTLLSHRGNILPNS